MDEKTLSDIKNVFDKVGKIKQAEFSMRITAQIIKTIGKLKNEGNGLAEAILYALAKNGNFVIVTPEVTHRIFKTLNEMQIILDKTADETKIVSEQFLKENQNENNN